MNKCPRCELNYKQDAEEYCPVCKKELMGKEDNNNLFDICVICNVNKAMEGENICEACARKVNEEPIAVVEAVEPATEFEPIMDGYTDMMDTDIPDCDLEPIREKLDDIDDLDEEDEER